MESVHVYIYEMECLGLKINKETDAYKIYQKLAVCARISAVKYVRNIQ
jgi:hypothetical protein